MLTHHLDEARALLWCKGTQKVTLRPCKQCGSDRVVMVLEHCRRLIPYGQRMFHADEERAPASWMVDVVREGRHEEGGDAERVRVEACGTAVRTKSVQNRAAREGDVDGVTE